MIKIYCADQKDIGFVNGSTVDKKIGYSGLTLLCPETCNIVVVDVPEEDKIKTTDTKQQKQSKIDKRLAKIQSKIDKKEYTPIDGYIASQIRPRQK